MGIKTDAALDRNTEQTARSLSQLLADTYVTYLKTQNCHWNIIDPRFHFLHEFFEELYKELAESVDEIAERMRMLQHHSPGSMRQFLELTTLEEIDAELPGDQMIHELCSDREKLIAFIRQKIEEASQAGDEGTADLLVQQLRMHEKAAWMLRSHL